MRKFENVDIIASLGAVVELNTEHYKGDFRHDIEMFKEAAKNPDGENNRLLWFSRRSGTHCFPERDVYIKDTAANNTWGFYATILGDVNSYMSTVVVSDRIIAFAVEVKDIENGRIKGDLCELNYRDHVKDIAKNALPKHTVTAKYKDGTKITLPYAEHDAKRERLYHQHGQLISLRADPQDIAALHDIVAQAQNKRGKEAVPAVFKLRVQSPKAVKQKQPSIKQQLSEGKKQIAAERAAAPVKTAVKYKNTGLGD